MSFVSNLIGANNGYQANSGAGPGSTAQQATDQTNFTNVQGNQSDLAKQLLAQSQGQGPNIANLQLQQATNQNNQQGAAAIASQRGMNPALAARIIANQTATNNQNAAGQSGVLRAQQQLAAQQGLANVYGQQAGESEANLGRLTQAQTAATSTNAGIAQSNANQNGSIAGGLLGGAASFLAAAHGGEIESPDKHLERLLISIGSKVHPVHLAGGGDIFGGMTDVGGGTFGPAFSAAYKPQAKKASDPLLGATDIQSADPVIGNSGVSGLPGAATSNAINPLETNQTFIAAHGGLVPAMISPGERVIPPHLVEAVRSGKKKASEVAPKVPGKAKKKGDSLENDTVPAKLAEGSVVVKRTKADNDADVREFLLAIQKEKASKTGPQGYAKVLAAKRKNA